MDENGKGRREVARYQAEQASAERVHRRLRQRKVASGLSERALIYVDERRHGLLRGRRLTGTESGMLANDRFR